MARAVAIVACIAATACGSSSGSPASERDAGGSTLDALDGGIAQDARSFPDGGAAGDGGGSSSDGAIAASRFVTGIVSYSPGGCAGFGQSSSPSIVEGPPVGGGTDHGSLDVLSLGGGGTLVLTFAPNAIVDGPGPDFIVFENPFWIGGSPDTPYAEPGQISVSDDGVTWTAFPCTPTLDPGASDGTGTAPPYGDCGGWQVVYSAPGNGISPFDATHAGGNAYDLADLDLKHVRYVKIIDQTHEACPDAGPDKPITNGFDLDAIAILNAELP
jgi:hypothetical protein